MMNFEDLIVEAVRSGKVRVPPYPAATLKLSGVLAKPEFDQNELAEVVKTDSMLTAAVLRLANSPNYQRGQPVCDITRAISRIGSRQLQTLAMALGVQSTVDVPGPLASLRRRAWLEGLCSARVCEVLAEVQGDAPETAFVGGLLHDLGRLLAIATLEDILKAHPELEAKSADAWWAIAERYHLELGLVLSATWQLPDDLVEVISSHHQPEPTDRVLQRVAISDEVVRLLDQRAGLTAQALGSIAGLSTRECEAVAAALEALPAFIESFELDATPEGPSKITPTVVRSVKRSGPQVTLHGVSHGPLSAQAVGLEGVTLLLSVPVALRANVLGRMESPECESMCIRVLACDAEGERFVAKVSPFALTVKQHGLWLAFGASLVTERAA